MTFYSGHVSELTFVENSSIKAMGRKGSETTIEERQIAFNMRCRGKSFREIAETLSRPVSTVMTIINRFKEEGHFESKPRTGRPKKISKSDEKLLVREIKKNPLISGPKLATTLLTTTGTNVSASAVRKTVNQLGYHGRVARRKPFISKKNKRARMEFARKHIAQPQEFWNRCIFTDESKFNIHFSDGHIRIFREINKEYEVRNLKGTVKHGGGSVMVWGCMSASGVGNLVFIDGIMDHKVYIKLLQDNLGPSVTKLGLEDSYIFTQDNDPKHRAWNTRMYLLHKNINYMETPPQSPDINPIEHLWSHLETQIRKRTINNIHQLRTALKEEWANITEDVTRNLVESMNRRLSAIIKSKGYPTKY